MKESAKISNAEWKIMEVLWNKSPLAPKEIVNALQAENWSYTTIMTMLMACEERSCKNYFK